MIRLSGSLLSRVILGALFLQAAPVQAGVLEDCTQTEDWWLRIEACTKAIDSGDWPGGRASWAFSNRAVAHAALGNYIGAFDDHEKAVRLDPANSSARNNKANSHADFREYDRALKEYSAAIALRPGYLNAHYNRAGVYMAVGRHTEAMADFTVVLNQIEDSGDAYLGRAEAACSAGDAEQSVSDRLAAITYQALDGELVAQYLKEKGYLSDDATEQDFPPALRAWTQAGCP